MQLSQVLNAMTSYDAIRIWSAFVRPQVGKLNFGRSLFSITVIGQLASLP